MPQRPALVDGEVTLSYGELETRSNQLAHHLIESGVIAGSTGVLLFDRSADFIVAALAMLKAGGAYVSIDSSTPPDRASYVVADSGAAVLITHHGKAGAVTLGSAKLVEVDAAAAQQIARQATTAPAIEYSPDNLAYVVYTSGSTGRPKGVEITHANVNCLIDWHETAFALTPADRGSHVSGLGFDVVAWELWPNLTAGAALHIADEATRRSPEELQQWIVQRQITVCFAPTVIAEQLLQANWPTTTVLRWLLIGGEALHRRPTSHLPFAVANCYGPSECTVVSTSGRVSPDGAESPTIGKPIPQTSALILDADLRPLPNGEAGELCLAGPHVGRGYRNNPAMTAQQFVVYSPPGGEDPVRIYRTGDRARISDNGEIAFLGRLDDQVKIRGYRIEPGEISAWLDKLPSIKKSVVLARDCGNGLELVAYIVAAQQPAPTANDLRKYLSAQLPDYMVPTRFVSLPAFATTFNGKIDRAALPLPTAANALPSDAVQTTGDPATPELEARIGTIIAALLGRPSVKGSDNFFMLGGHSMLGVQLAAKIRDTLGVKLTLRQLFSAPTVNALSAEVRRLSPTGTPVSQKGSN
jgi:amino acid adenylation domain-containing protein